ncbi:MAG: tRNA dihydrouridine(20/20a) synthase DusA [Alphaproteobacteria bacterium]|nr:tRNA dihydrouridine(20/20a) synthase DusA [Alphaproteobacteria bacterium]
MIPSPPLSIAPMMDRTDRHFRFVMRQISRRTLLYTEMVTTGALLHGDADRHLAFHPEEDPVALQLGGDDPVALAQCAVMAEQRGYSEVNLNVGCPSDRVQKGSFGAVLMKTPERVAECVAAMRARVRIPVTVKHRIGVDDLDRYEDMAHFVETVAAAGAARFTVHARIAWLQGLSPKQNRNVPPLRYDDVYRLKADRPELQVEINGGIKTLDEVLRHLERVDAVMIGRAAVDDPWMFAAADRRLFGGSDPTMHKGSDPARHERHAGSDPTRHKGSDPTRHTGSDPTRHKGSDPTRESILPSIAQYAAHHVESGGKLHHVYRHLFQLYRGEPGARTWRRTLTEGCQDPTARPDLLLEAARAQGRPSPS